MTSYTGYGAARSRNLGDGGIHGFTTLYAETTRAAEGSQTYRASVPLHLRAGGVKARPALDPSQYEVAGLHPLFLL